MPLELLSSLAPQGMAPWVAIALLGFSFFTSAVTAVFSLGGGVAMMAGLGIVLPPPVLIPVHGCIQLGSNAGRAIVQRAHIQWRMVLWFGTGTVAGSIIGGNIALAIPEQIFGLAIGLFILYSVWGPQPRVTGRGPLADLAAGTVIGVLGMIVGVVGVLVGNFLRKLDDRRQLIATHAMLVALNNLAKVATFIALGFAFADYAPLIAGMIATGFIGTMIGSRLLDRVPEEGFRKIFKLVLTVLALEMIRAAIF